MCLFCGNCTSHKEKFHVVIRSKQEVELVYIAKSVFVSSLELHVSLYVCLWVHRILVCDELTNTYKEK